MGKRSLAEDDSRFGCVLKQLKSPRPLLHGIANEDGMLATEYVKVLIEAVEKQISSPVEHRLLRDTEINSPWGCQICGADLCKVEFLTFDGGESENQCSYCWHCGSKLDWSKEE